MTPVFDTNILIDHLLGHDAAKEELAQFPTARISLITWIEVMVGAGDDLREEARLRRFLERFEVIPLNDQVAATTVRLRATRRIPLPDAVIWASAKVFNAILITRNTKDFPADEPDVRFPYVL